MVQMAAELFYLVFSLDYNTLTVTKACMLILLVHFCKCIHT